jgi:uncharacterized protein
MKGRCVSKRSLRTAMRCGIGAAAAMGAAMALLAAGAARAAIFPDLYTLTVELDPEARDSRAAAVDTAMRKLLVRITGRREPDADPALQGLIGNASRFVASVGVGFDRERAEVEFYPTQVDRELASLNQPVWGPERPLTLLWVAIDGGDGDRVLLSADGVGGAGLPVAPGMAELARAIREQIETVADERGLPLALPLLDLEDLDAVSSGDVWGGFVEPVLVASARYGADAVLIGRLRLNPFGNSMQWTLVRGADRRSFSGAEPAEGLHWLADTYAADFSVLGGARIVRLIVRDVTSYADYGRVMSYLEGLSTLQSVDVEGYEGGMLSLRASARGEVGVLQRMLGLGRVLELDRESIAGPDNTLVLRVARGAQR